MYSIKIAFIATTFLMASFSVAQKLEPGTWKAETRLKVNGIPLPSSDEQECVSESQAKDAKTTISKELEKQGCSVTKWSMKNNKLDAALVCKNNDMDAKGALRGELSSKSYDLTGEAEGTYINAIPSIAEIKLAGRWVGTCRK